MEPEVIDDDFIDADFSDAEHSVIVDPICDDTSNEENDENDVGVDDIEQDDEPQLPMANSSENSDDHRIGDDEGENSNTSAHIVQFHELLMEVDEDDVEVTEHEEDYLAETSENLQQRREMWAAISKAVKNQFQMVCERLMDHMQQNFDHAMSMVNSVTEELNKTFEEAGSAAQAAQNSFQKLSQLKQRQTALFASSEDSDPNQ